MTKPKITEGEWKPVSIADMPDSTFGDWWEIHFTDDGECVAEVVHEEPDAKLMAAAPHMLNDLIEAYQKLIQIGVSHGHLVNQKQLEKIELTLKQAGVTL